MKTRKNAVYRTINKLFSTRFNVFFLAHLWIMSGFYSLKSHLGCCIVVYMFTSTHCHYVSGTDMKNMAKPLQ